MILIDTGPLVALLDRDDSYHTECVASAARLPSGPVLTTWPCFTEAMYLLQAAGGWDHQSKLWALYQNGKLIIHHAQRDESLRMAELMKTYHDQPMDLADASLVAVAEAITLRDIFTIDRHFHVYRLRDGSVLNVVP